MGIKEEILSYTKRQEDVHSHSALLTEAQKGIITDIQLLQKRVARGETTGDSILDYAICNISASLDKTFSEAVGKKYESTQTHLSKFTPNEVYVLDYDKFIVELSDPSHVVLPDRKKVLFNLKKAFIIKETKMNGLELKLHSLESCETEGIGDVMWRSSSYKGWDLINERFSSNPLLLRSIYEQFGRKADDELYRKANESYHELAKKAVLQIDSLSKLQKDLWDKIESQRKRLEDLREKAENAKGRIVLSIGDQLDKNAAEINYETEFLKGIRNYDQRREHERQLRKIEMCLEDAISLGLDNFEKEVIIEVMPGESRVFNVAKYIKTLCNYMEIATDKSIARV